MRAQQKQGFGAFAARYAERAAAAARVRGAESVPAPVPESADAPTHDTPEPRDAPADASPVRGLR